MLIYLKHCWLNNSGIILDLIWWKKFNKNFQRHYLRFDLVEKFNKNFQRYYLRFGLVEKFNKDFQRHYLKDLVSGKD